MVKVKRRLKRFNTSALDKIIDLHEKTAREIFDIPNLKKISKGGSDRQVFDLGGNKVLKVAKTARGLAQNEAEWDFNLAGGILPQVFYKGKNFLIVEKVYFDKKRPLINALCKYLKNQDTYTPSAYERKYNMDRALENAEEQFKIPYLTNLRDYDYLIGDLTAPRNWGVTGRGRVVLADGGTVSSDSIMSPPQWVKGEWEEVKQKNRELKKLYGDTDKIIASSLVTKAKIEKEFLEKNKDLPETVVYQTPPIKGGKKFLSVIRRGDKPSNYYYYSQRVGKDSIRFLLYDANKKDKPFGVLEQFEASQNRTTVGAFSGSMDKPNLTPKEICREEVNEESEYTVTKAEMNDRIFHLKNMRVGSQTNEVAYLYIVNVTGLKTTPKKPENEWEENTDTHWLSLEEIKDYCNWEAFIIADRAKAIFKEL